MYPEITSQLQRTKKTLEDYHHLDSRLDQCLVDLMRSVEFLAKKVWEMDQNKPAPARDPYGFMPGSDD